MANKKQTLSLYEQIVKITDVYLGPATERFIDRQIENHLHVTPQKLTKKDLGSLIDWIRVVVSLLTDDREMVEEYIVELEKLAK
jgi:hypothetical protein